MNQEKSKNEIINNKCVTFIIYANIQGRKEEIDQQRAGRRPGYLPRRLNEFYITTPEFEEEFVKNFKKRDPDNRTLKDKRVWMRIEQTTNHIEIHGNNMNPYPMN